MDDLGTHSGPAPLDVPAPGGPAYPVVIGRPKGVVVTHRAPAHFSRAADRERYAINRGDRVLQFASTGFDACVEEIHRPLAAGATVVIRDEDMISRPACS